MKYIIYEDPVTHRFTLLQLPPRFVEGDPLQPSPTDEWFDWREDAVAAVPGLLDREE